MDKAEALVERARLQKLLDVYEAGRSNNEDVEQGSPTHQATPDRAGNVRARIARLDQLITDIDDAQRP